MSACPAYLLNETGGDMRWSVINDAVCTSRKRTVRNLRDCSDSKTPWNTAIAKLEIKFYILYMCNIFSEPDDFSDSIKSLSLYSTVIDYLFKMMERTAVLVPIFAVWRNIHNYYFLIIGIIFSSILILDLWIKFYCNTINYPHAHMTGFFFSRFGRISQFLILTVSAIAIMFFGSRFVALFIQLQIRG